MCVDYHGLNNIIVKICYPLPLIFGLLEQLRQAKIYTKIDLSRVYDLVCVKERTNEKLHFD